MASALHELEVHVGPGLSLLLCFICFLGLSFWLVRIVWSDWSDCISVLFLVFEKSAFYLLRFMLRATVLTFEVKGRCDHQIVRNVI